MGRNVIEIRNHVIRIVRSILTRDIRFERLFDPFNSKQRHKAIKLVSRVAASMFPSCPVFHSHFGTSISVR